MVSFLISAVAFLAILAPLVIIHELGHFLFARLFNVKVEAFSIGFGPKLFAQTRGETDFRLSLIPLGGYVKLLGEDRTQPLSAEDSKRALHTQATWKRFLIFFGGPLFNFLGAIFIFMCVLVIGEKQVSSFVGRVVPGSAAEKVGFLSSDRIVRIGDRTIDQWEQVLMEWSAAPGQTLAVQVERAGGLHELLVTPAEADGLTLYGEQKKVGDVDGLIAVPRNTIAAVSDPGSAAGKAGVVTGAEIVSVTIGNQEALLKSWEDLESALARAPMGAAVSIAIRSSATESARSINLGQKKVALASAQLEAWGLFSSELIVDKALPGSPAETAGLKKGDHLWAINGERIGSFFQLRSRVQSEGERAGQLELTWMRAGKLTTQKLQLNRSESRDALLKKVTTFTIGVMPMPFQSEPVWMVERVWNPFLLLYKSTIKVIVLTYRNVVSIAKMLMGQVSTATLGGPIMIGKIAGEAITSGITEFLSRMAFFSIGLGVLNLMPVPVLDGGHIVLLGIERIRRKPLTLKQLSIVQMVGLVLILTLMGKVFFNDFSRL